MEHYYGDIVGMAEAGGGMDVTVRLPAAAARQIWNRGTRAVEVGVEDGRLISPAQRRKIYATLRDISDHTGYTVEAAKQVLKVEHMLRTGEIKYFSLADCSVTTAREYINTLMEYALREGIILAESGLERTDDIDTYLIQCIRLRRCCICGRTADIHHVDAIGMGHDRRNYDDGMSRVMALCRMHHTACHRKGTDAFSRMYKVYGIEKYRVADQLPGSGTEKDIERSGSNGKV